MQKTIDFLTANMKEMEIELRAQSIALDALGSGLVKPRELQDALKMARSSEAMLTYVEQKYEHLRKVLPKLEQAKSEQEMRELVRPPVKPRGYMQ